MKSSQQGVVYIVGLIFIFLTAIFAAGFLLVTSIEHRHVVRDQLSLTALYLAEAGVDDAIWALKNLWTTSKWTAAGWTAGTTYTKTVSSFTDSTGEIIGDYSVTITNPTSTTPTIESTGYSPSVTAEDNMERTVKIEISLSAGNGNVKAAVQTNTKTTTTGQLEVDGRNHDMDNVLISPGGTGVLGLYTTEDFTTSPPSPDQGGNSDIGGTSSTSIDYAPSKPANPAVIGVSQTWPGGYPMTPDAVMEYTEGTLIAKAQSGTGGSQLIDGTPGHEISDMTFPLKGVTYIDINYVWNIPGSVDLSGTGVLIVHSHTGGGNTGGLKTLNAGLFKGMVIADKIDKIHLGVLGCVITMSSEVPGPSEDCIGNGNGWVHYSSQAVSKAFWATGNVSLTWQER